MEFLSRGGILIWPILLGSVLALYVIIERAIFVASVLPARRKALKALVESLGNPGEKLDESKLGSFTKAVNRAREEGAVNQSLLMQQADSLVGEAERGLSLLHMIAQAAPLLGLLGTVIGMIGAFIEIQDLGGQVTPSDLAGGIWVALITTAAGLTVAIPALIAWIGYSRSADRYASFVESIVWQIIHKLSRSGLEII